MNAIILAGGNLDEGDPLYDENPNQPKSLIDVAGKPMVQWVIEALDRAQLTKDLIVVGLEGVLGLGQPSRFIFSPTAEVCWRTLKLASHFLNKLILRMRMPWSYPQTYPL